MEAGKIWLGPADDTVLRKRGVEFVDGSAPVLPPSSVRPRIRKPPRMIVEEYQKPQPLHLLRGQPERHHGHRAAA
jgi:acetyl-CoA synthase